MAVAHVRRLLQFAPSRAVACGVGLVALVSAVLFGLSHVAVYPTVSLRGVAARLTPLERPGDVVFVDTFNSFGWCYYGLSPCRFQVGGSPVWPQGFRPVSMTPDVFIASHYGIPLPEFTAAQRGAHRIWYVGYDYGTFDVGAGAARANRPVCEDMTGLLQADGWRQAFPSKTTDVLGLHDLRVLYVKVPNGPRSGPSSAGPGARDRRPRRRWTRPHVPPVVCWRRGGADGPPLRPAGGRPSPGPELDGRLGAIADATADHGTGGPTPDGPRVLVRPAVDADAGAIARLLVGGSREPGAEDVAAPARYVAALPRIRGQGGEVLVADAGGDVLGVCQVLDLAH